jgi:hypothetical protein
MVLAYPTLAAADVAISHLQSPREGMPRLTRRSGDTIAAMLHCHSFWSSIVVVAILAGPAIAAEWNIEGRVIGICAS